MTETYRRDISYFDGTIGAMLGYRILVCLLVIFTLGLGLAWAIVIYQTWETQHTVVSGKRLLFIGTAGDLFIQFLKWTLLSMITLGIYSFWANLNYKKWLVENTIFAN